MKRVIFFALAVISAAVYGKEIFVDYSSKEEGSGTGEKPFNKFASAMKIASPGDTIKILPVEQKIADSIVIKNFAGDKNNPLVIDGSFNTFTGVEPADSKVWVRQAPGLWKRQLRTSRGIAER